MPDDLVDILKALLNERKPDKKDSLKDAINDTLDAYKKLTPEEHQQLKDWSKDAKELIRGVRTLLEGKPEPPPDLGPQYVFTHPSCIVTYAITQPNLHVLAANRSLAIETSLLQMLNANPMVDLAGYQIALGIKILKIERQPAERSGILPIGEPY